ncbi:MAG TPA: response regulator [Syntrophorhabdales bacterium]|nr:response regulator [Syntrophorhabdales bacterium]
MEKKVLLIDDEASLRRHVTLGLMQQGYYTEPCENGMKGLETLNMFKRKNTPLDCAIVDVRLPDIDGIKLLKVIKLNYPQLPVIIITGHGDAAVEEAVKAERADGYLEKPFTMEELTELLEQVPTPAPAPKKEETTAPVQSYSAYALVTLDAKADILEAYRTLYFQENVLYCDAIRGDHDLMLLLQAETPEAIREVVDTKIKMVKGVTDITMLNVDSPMFGENVVDIIGSVDKALGREKEEGEVYSNQTARTRTSSYVLLEIEKEKLASIYPSLYFDDQVVYCDCTRGKYDIVLLMKGTSFAEIGNIVKNKFKQMDGVLRVKEWPIITLLEM